MNIPKFIVPYTIVEDIDKKLQPGSIVGLRSNTTCGIIKQCFWSNTHNQWVYAITPWSDKDSRRLATEDVILSIEEWLHGYLTETELGVISNLDFTSKHVLTYAISSNYKSLLSGRASLAVTTRTNGLRIGAIDNLKRLCKEYLQ